MNAPVNIRRADRGSVTMWLAPSSFAMAMMVGLAVDLGGQVHAQQRAHDLAAQAARAGGEQVQAAPAIQGQTASVDIGAARRAAEAYLDAAAVSGSVAVSGGDSLSVTVHDTYDTKFLGLIGITHLDVTSSATAHLVRTLGGTAR